MNTENNLHIPLEQNESSSESESGDGSRNTSLFDTTIGHIEDILVDDDFLEMQKSFLEKYWKEFDETEENRLCYTAIFEEYVSKLEDFIEKKLKQEIPQFDMDGFYHQLLLKKGTLEGEVFDTLYTLSDFIAFKEMVLDYRNMKEGKTADFSSCISVKPITFDDDGDN